MTADVRERAEAIIDRYLSHESVPYLARCAALAAVEEALRESLPAEPDLSDPVVVHMNMLRGTIAKPTIAQIEHLYQRKFAEPEPEVDPLLVEAREIVAGYWESAGSLRALAQRVRSGSADEAPSVQIALAALRSRPKREDVTSEGLQVLRAPDLASLRTGLVKGTAPPEPEDEWGARAGEVAYRIEKDDPMTRHILRDELIRCHREGFNEALEKAKGGWPARPLVWREAQETLDSLKLEEPR